MPRKTRTRCCDLFGVKLLTPPLTCRLIGFPNNWFLPIWALCRFGSRFPRLPVNQSARGFICPRRPTSQSNKQLSTGDPGYPAVTWGSLGAFACLFGGHRTRPCQRTEHIFWWTAAWAPPVFREILKTGPRGNLTFLIPMDRVINITAVGKLALPHLFRFWHHILQNVAHSSSLHRRGE